MPGVHSGVSCALKWVSWRRSADIWATMHNTISPDEVFGHSDLGVIVANESWSLATNNLF